MTNGVSSYLPLFLQTSRESLNSLKKNLALFGAEEETVRNEAKFEAFRMVHTIHGRSLFMTLSQLTLLTTDLSKFLDQVRNGIKNVDENSKTILEETVQRIEEDLQSLETNGKEIDMTDQISKIKSLIT